MYVSDLRQNAFSFRSESTSSTRERFAGLIPVLSGLGQEFLGSLQKLKELTGVGIPRRLPALLTRLIREPVHHFLRISTLPNQAGDLVLYSGSKKETSTPSCIDSFRSSTASWTTLGVSSTRR